MKILIVSQYFWPENFRINDFTKGLKERGFEVTVLTGLPNYPKGNFFKGYSFFNNKTEYYDGIKIIRSKLIPRSKSKGINLVLNYTSFAFFASLKILFLKGKFNKIFVYEPSPVTVGFPAIIAKLKFNAKLFFWVQDLWPESVSAASKLKNKFVIKFLDQITRYIYSKCDKILVQSNGFKQYIINQGVKADKIVYFPNTIEKIFTENIKCKNPFPDNINKPIILFAGNIGKAQNFDLLVDVLKRLDKNRIKLSWVILGDGRDRDRIQQKIDQKKLSKNIFFLGSFPINEVPKFYKYSDALFVSLTDNKIFSMTIPNKIQSYLAAGKPIIASLNGEGAKIIEDSGSGFISKSGDVNGLYDNLLKFYSLSKKQREVLGKNGKAYFMKEFEREILLDKFEKIIKS